MNLFKNRKALIIAGGLGVVIILAILAVASLRNTGSNSTATPTPSPSQNYFGTQLILDRGASADVVEDFKFATYTYLKSVNQKPSSIKIDNVSHLHKVDPTSGASTETYVFNLTFDSKPRLLANLSSSDDVTARLTLTDLQTKKQVFDSGDVKVDTGE